MDVGTAQLHAKLRADPRVLNIERFHAKAAGMNLLVMGSVAGAGGGCACAANALVKSLLGHLLEERRQWVLVDLEAGVEHLGRGTVESVDGLVVVSEPSLRGLETAANVSRLAYDPFRMTSIKIKTCDVRLGTLRHDCLIEPPPCECIHYYCKCQ